MRNGLVPAAFLALCLPAMASENPPAVPSPGSTVGELPPEEPAWQEPDPMPVPPGSAADQSLWRAAGEVNNQVTSSRWAANALQWKVNRGDLVRRLDAAAKADPASAARLSGLRDRLVTAQVENYNVLVGRWPVDTTRACQYPQSQLASAMNAGDGPDKKALLGEARADATRCVDLAGLAVGRMERSTAAFSAAVADAEKALAGSAPAAPLPAGATGK